LPLFAPEGPPLTGESSIAMPLAAKRPEICRTTVGELVERSNHAVPLRMPASKSSATAWTSFGPGSDVNTTSAASANLRAESAQVAPAWRCGAANSRRMSLTITS